MGEVPRPADFEANRKPPTKKLVDVYVDILPKALEQEHPAGFATYAVEVLNSAGRGAGLSNQVHVPLLPALPPFSDFAAKVVPQGVLISWQCEAVPGAKLPGVRYVFRIYRRQEGTTRSDRIGDLVAPCRNEPAASDAFIDLPAAKRENHYDSFLDQNLDWEKTYFYHGTVVSEMPAPGKPAVEVEGDDTPDVKVFAHDVFPPAVPTGLQAVFSGPGQQPFIDLIWSPVTDADLAGYNIYRHEGGKVPMKLNSELVKTPAFRDTQVASGQTYFYSVTAVDQRGNESERSEEASERVP